MDNIGWFVLSTIVLLIMGLWTFLNTQEIKKEMKKNKEKKEQKK